MNRTFLWYSFPPSTLSLPGRLKGSYILFDLGMSRGVIMSPAHSIDSLEEMRDGPRLRTLFFACKFGFYDKAVQQITASFNAAIKLHNLVCLRLSLFIQHPELICILDRGSTAAFSTARCTTPSTSLLLNSPASKSWSC